MKRYLIERNLLSFGTRAGLDAREMASICRAAASAMGPRVQWEYSYVSEDKIFCVLLAEDIIAIRRHADLSGFPAEKINLITGILDPTT